MTLTLTRPWSNIDTAHRLIILDICAKLFENPTRGSKDIERTRKCDGRMSGRTDGRTKELKTICLPISWGRHNYCIFMQSLSLQCGFPLKTTNSCKYINIKKLFFKTDNSFIKFIVHKHVQSSNTIQWALMTLSINIFIQIF